MVDPQLTLMALLVRHVLLPREILPPIEIHSSVSESNRRAGLRYSDDAIGYVTVA
jgi:hypothetical protein